MFLCQISDKYPVYEVLYQVPIHAAESMILLRYREIFEYPIAESTHLLQNHQISNINRIFGVVKVLQSYKISQHIRDGDDPDSVVALVRTTTGTGMKRV